MQRACTLRRLNNNKSKEAMRSCIMQNAPMLSSLCVASKYYICQAVLSLCISLFKYEGKILASPSLSPPLVSNLRDVHAQCVWWELMMENYIRTNIKRPHVELHICIYSKIWAEHQVIAFTRALCASKSSAGKSAIFKLPPATYAIMTHFVSVFFPPLYFLLKMSILVSFSLNNF